jgi:hypothetical protein
MPNVLGDASLYRPDLVPWLVALEQPRRYDSLGQSPSSCRPYRPAASRVSKVAQRSLVRSLWEMRNWNPYGCLMMVAIVRASHARRVRGRLIAVDVCSGRDGSSTTCRPLTDVVHHKFDVVSKRTQPGMKRCPTGRIWMRGRESNLSRRLCRAFRPLRINELAQHHTSAPHQSASSAGHWITAVLP